jgi:hypothetical protein
LAAYNPQDPPEILFKRCTNVQEIATLAKNLYTTQLLLITTLDFITRTGLYQHNIEDWEHSPTQIKRGSIYAHISKRHTNDP